MSRYHFSHTKMFFPLAATALILSACGGGGGGSESFAGVGSGGTGFVSGSVTKGPVGSANVTAYAVTAGQAGAPIGTAMTNASGNFNMSIGSYAGPVMLQVNGGSYTDEATGSVMPMAAGDVMTALLPSVLAGTTTTGIQVTPLTAMAQALAQHMAGGMTDANMATASLSIGNHFAVSDILHVAPMNPLIPGSGTGASQDAQNYGMILAAMSKYAQTLGVGTSSTMVTAMMNDASDGVFDGKSAGAAVQMGGMGGAMMLPPTAGTSGLGTAMNAFMTSAQNRSGVMSTDLVNKLNAATGQIQNPIPAMASASVSGTAFNGQVSSGTMTAFAINNGAMGAQIASGAVDAQGHFTMPLGTYTGPVLLQMTGATYIDEATRTTMTMAAGDVMSAVLPTIASGASVTGVMVTPVTAMAQSRALGMTGGMTNANIAAANSAMGAYFGVTDILHTPPMNPTAAGAGVGTSQDARNYGMTLAAMSEYAKSLRMPVSSTLIGAMMQDASDGIMDGRSGMTQISTSTGGMSGSSMMPSTAGTTSLVEALASFMSSPANASGLVMADMLALKQRLIGSGGRIGGV